MKSLIAAAALTVGMFALGTSAADARPYHHGHGYGWGHHHRHCVTWAWHHHHRHPVRFCRRWGW